MPSLALPPADEAVHHDVRQAPILEDGPETPLRIAAEDQVPPPPSWLTATTEP
ncbi:MULTISPECIES: hypothetical protein [unclassified Rathayibacter]|jgi:hypothetical protein|uniref:hypothetical protein n=1 Tax=unclassified Rathayibacter TaxID=2609250 RepID=UPI0015E484EE|nr:MULTISPECIES: hypothetical protein [unclassified Rathayibacter]